VSTDTAPTGAATATAGEEEDGWRIDRQGRKFVAARGRSGIVYRQGNETVEEALARDGKGPRDKPPKKAGGAQALPKAAKPPAPTQQDLKELEHALAEGLRAPAMIAAAAGDEWLATHFTQQGPILARHLVSAARHNPWLRSKLEAAMHGEDVMVKVITTMSVGGALVGYAVPPIIYMLNPPFVSPKAREMFGVPDRKPPQTREEHDAGTAPPAAAAPAAGQGA
jgi:hypothetical protein